MDEANLRTLLVEAYRLAGCSTRSLSLKGCFMLSPYTELDDAYTTTCTERSLMWLRLVYLYNCADRLRGCEWPGTACRSWCYSIHAGDISVYCI